MQRCRIRRLKSEKGLTLIELLAIIVILVIVLAIAVPSMGKIIENSRINAEKSDALIALGAADLYFVENYKGYTNSISIEGLITEGFMDGLGYMNNSSFIRDTKPSKICAGPFEGNKVTFYNATAKEIANSGKSIHVGGEVCGDANLTPPGD